MAANFSHVCLTEKQQMMNGTPLEYNLQRYVYPAIALFGILGNVLNLTVLLNKSMRSRANTFLATLAFADIIFLSLLFPNILANYSFFTFNYYFRYFYFHTKVHLISLANWCSAVAIWCVIAVCGDRLVGIRSPLYARSTWSWWKLPAVIMFIVAVAGGLTFYQHFEYYCLVRSYCNETQLYSRCLPVYSVSWFGKRENPFSPAFQQLISLCVLVYALTMIILPIVLLTMLNLMLLCALRKRQKHLAVCADATERRNNEGQMQKTEHRVTLTVTFIVTMFTLTNGPSALMHLIRTAYNLKQQDLYDLTMICSTLVICGKASNFILFCLGSRHFRLRLIRLTQRKVHRKIGEYMLFYNAFKKKALVMLPSHGNLSHIREVNMRESLSGTLLTNTMSRAIARRQSCPSKKSSTIGTPCKSRNLSTADIYRPLVRDLSKDFGSHC
ncbi:7 transmembrane receptor [Ancylostoma caninum]|uniref:7 transmembrane receptor n=1 Tax=Ancylostoma caninum TaxID=29170 RepID=A0A368H8K4_ANCCA|nr:7 transmembrane receptor [Ancylostoma caninum]